MSKFPEMVEIVPEGVHGVACVEHFEVSREASRFSCLRGGRDYVPEGRYARLRVNGCLYMSDTRMERMTNWEVANKARGKVLIAGLGLGMIVHPILAKPEVESVLVVEKYADVITLVGPTVRHKKLTIVEGDIFTWRPERGAKFDTIYFDIWADQSTDDLEKMKQLHTVFRPFRAKGAWVESWRRGELKAQKRSSRYY